MRVSDCCGAEPWGETDLCSECKEHAEFEDENDRTCSNNGEEVETTTYSIKTYLDERREKDLLLTRRSTMH